MLEPGGVLVFTDIMGADGADEKALKDFTDRNATTEMARPSGYLDWLKAAGFCHTGFFDGSGHLLPYFAAMLAVRSPASRDALRETAADPRRREQSVDASRRRVAATPRLPRLIFRGGATTAARRRG